MLALSLLNSRTCSMRGHGCYVSAGEMTSFTTTVLSSVSTTHAELFSCSAFRNPVRLWS